MSKKNKGYIVCTACGSSTLIPGAEHIEKDDSSNRFVDDYAAAMQAEKDGIPIIHDIPGLEDWTYLDTPANRRLITTALAKP